MTHEPQSFSLGRALALVFPPEHLLLHGKQLSQSLPASMHPAPRQILPEGQQWPQAPQLLGPVATGLAGAAGSVTQAAVRVHVAQVVAGPGAVGLVRQVHLWLGSGARKVGCQAR